MHDVAGDRLIDRVRMGGICESAGFAPFSGSSLDQPIRDRPGHEAACNAGKGGDQGGVCCVAQIRELESLLL